MDLIERQAAIDAIQNEVEPFVIIEPGTTCVIGAGVKDEDVIRIIEQLPPAQPEQRWIPCSERLPEESGYYIVTAHNGVGHRTTFVKYQKKAKSWDLTGARSYWRVIAWMPMPEPYQEGSEER